MTRAFEQAARNISQTVQGIAQDARKTLVDQHGNPVGAGGSQTTNEGGVPGQSPNAFTGVRSGTSGPIGLGEAGQISRIFFTGGTGGVSNSVYQGLYDATRADMAMVDIIKAQKDAGLDTDLTRSAPNQLKQMLENMTGAMREATQRITEINRQLADSSLSPEKRAELVGQLQSEAAMQRATSSRVRDIEGMLPGQGPMFSPYFMTGLGAAITTGGFATQLPMAMRARAAGMAGVDAFGSRAFMAGDVGSIYAMEQMGGEDAVRHAAGREAMNSSLARVVGGGAQILAGSALGFTGLPGFMLGAQGAQMFGGAVMDLISLPQQTRERMAQAVGYRMEQEKEAIAAIQSAYNTRMSAYGNALNIGNVGAMHVLDMSKGGSNALPLAVQLQLRARLAGGGAALSTEDIMRQMTGLAETGLLGAPEIMAGLYQGGVGAGAVGGLVSSLQGQLYGAGFDPTAIGPALAGMAQQAGSFVGGADSAVANFRADAGLARRMYGSGGVTAAELAQGGRTAGMYRDTITGTGVGQIGAFMGLMGLGVEMSLPQLRFLQRRGFQVDDATLRKMFPGSGLTSSKVRDALAGGFDDLGGFIGDEAKTLILQQMAPDMPSEAAAVMGMGAREALGQTIGGPGVSPPTLRQNPDRVAVGQITAALEKQMVELEAGFAALNKIIGPLLIAADQLKRAFEKLSLSSMTGGYTLHPRK